MAKRGFPGGRPMGGGMPNLNNLMKQAQQMQKNMQKTQEELAEKTVEASSGGGAVTITATGTKEITTVKINPDVLDPDDPEMLEDLILTAVNEALKKADELAGDEMNKATGGMGGLGGGLPGLF